MRNRWQRGDGHLVHAVRVTGRAKPAKRREQERCEAERCEKTVRGQDDDRLQCSDARFEREQEMGVRWRTRPHLGLMFQVVAQAGTDWWRLGLPFACGCSTESF
jgi:hypothetical protein